MESQIISSTTFITENTEQAQDICEPGQFPSVKKPLSVCKLARIIGLKVSLLRKNLQFRVSESSQELLRIIGSNRNVNTPNSQVHEQP